MRSLAIGAVTFLMGLGAAGAVEVPVDGLTLENASDSDGMVSEAIRHFKERVEELGGSTAPAEGGTLLHVGEIGEGAALAGYFTPEVTEEHRAGLKPFQEKEAYFLALEEEGGRPILRAAGFSPLGTVHAVSELELRLRAKDGRVFLAFPEWTDDAPKRIFDKPEIEGRGEYLNIGYNLQQITPHEWSDERWRAYIDQLVLAKLNRFYFYVWIDTYTMNPASELSKRPLNRQIHERVKNAIEYAHKRGLDVTYMFCPSFFPKDMWEARPEIHADIEYVKHGFPAVCSSAPGAWDLMKENARAEFEWFKEADAIQLWFYDPGGCWCEKYGCKPNQAEILTRQVKEFSDLFRAFNPDARVEYNYWPMWLWEANLELKYREDMDRRIQEAFGPDYKQVTAVGAPDADFTMPLIEQEMGYRTGIFLFGANPERSYVFTNPQLEWVQYTSRLMHEHDMNAVFGHRLEAWTRLPQTFLMAQFLWNPGRKPADAARKLAEWQAVDPALGDRMTEVVLMMDRYSTYGADAELGARMAEEMGRVYEEAPAAAKEDLEILLTTAKAMEVIARSKDKPEGEWPEYERQFTEIMTRSPSFGAWTADWPRIFEHYRQWLIGGWNKEHF